MVVLLPEMLKKKKKMHETIEIFDVQMMIVSRSISFCSQRCVLLCSAGSCRLELLLRCVVQQRAAACLLELLRGTVVVMSCVARVRGACWEPPSVFCCCSLV